MPKNETNDWKIPLYKIYTDDEDVQLITKIVRRGSSWAIGPEIEEFEESIKNYVGTDYCLTLNSGTSALHASFLAYGFGTGDEIVINADYDNSKIQFEEKEIDLHYDKKE